MPDSPFPALEAWDRLRERRREGRFMDLMRPPKHTCTERCVCPEDGKPLIYWPAGDEHACQDVDCRYGHGGLITITLTMIERPEMTDGG